MTNKLTDVKTSALVDLYNSLSDKPVKKFLDRATAEARVMKLVNEKNLTLVVSEGAVEAVDPTEDTTETTDKVDPKLDSEETKETIPTGAPAETAEAKTLREQIEAAEIARLAKKKAEKPAKSGARGPAPLYADTAKIKLIVAENPKRAGTASHTRFSLYKDGMTVAEFVAAGGKRADLDWDVAHKFIAAK